MAEIFLIEVATFDRSFQTGTYFPEREGKDLTRAETVKDIRTGQYEDVARVIAVNVEAGIARDATKEIARAILNELDEPPMRFLQTFLEDVLGCGVVARLLREMEEA